jgi:hypothetical protein
MRYPKWKFMVPGSLLVLSIVVAPAVASASRTPTTRAGRAAAPPTAARDGAGWLGRQFLSSGDLPTSENVAGLDNLPLALTALVAAGTGRAPAAAGLGYLEAHFQSFVSESVSKTKSVDLPGRLAEVILAAVAGGANPARFGGNHPANDLLARLLATETKTGSDAGLFGSPDGPTYSSAYTEGLALLALAAAGQSNRLGDAWLVRQQCSNGGWTTYRPSTSKACPAENPAKFAGADTNSTALATQALVAQKTTPRLSPLSFFEKAEYPNGGFGYIGTVAKSQPVDPDSTAVVIQALVALHKLDDPSFSKSGGAKPERALSHFQLGCAAPVSERGAYDYPGAKGPNLFATIQAIPAAAEKAFPIKKGTLSPDLPRTSCSSSKRARLLATAASSAGPTCPRVPKPSSGQVVVPIVVDFGSGTSKIDATCVAVPTGSTGSDVLEERASVLHTNQPVYNSAGLLCQIDGYPSSGCGTQHGAHYAYWAYFHGGTKWTYANDGPAENQVSRGDVEGWRFEPEGSASPSDPPPRAPSSASILEASSSKPPASTTTTLPATNSSSPSATTAPNDQATTTTDAPSSKGGATTTSGGASPKTGGDTSGGPSTAGSSDKGSTASSGSDRTSSHSAIGSLDPNGAGTSSKSGRDALLAAACLIIVAGAAFALLRSRRRLGGER